MALTELTATELLAELRQGSATAVDVTSAYLDRIQRFDARLGAFLRVNQDDALAQAESVDRRRSAGQSIGPLGGLPVAIKDVLCTKDEPTTCGSRMLQDFRPPYDATVVARLKQADAVLIGKTNLDEFAMGSSTEHSAFGPTHNPHDLTRVPGGSSGGSAAAVAAGFAPIALGSDTGGSIRQPASLCGVVGVKPTYGLVSRYGLIAFASSFDQIGPFANDVADAALTLEVIGGHDPLDSTSIPSQVPDLAKNLDRGVEGLRVGLVRELLEGIDEDVVSRVHEVADLFSSAGAEVDFVSVPAVEYGLTAYYLIAPAEASSNLARYDGVRYGMRAEGADVKLMNSSTRRSGFGDEVIARVMLGTFALSAGYYDAYYGKAQKVRTLTRRDFDAAYANHDVLLSPTSPSVAFKFGERSDPMTMYRCDTCTVPSNLIGDPAMSIPFGTGAYDMPVGVQVMAPQLGESLMFQTASFIESQAPVGGTP